MIKSYEDLVRFIREDAKSSKIKSKYQGLRSDIFRFQIYLRLFEYALNCKKIYVPLIKLIYLRKSMKLGFTIPPNVFLEGLSIAHYGTIVINRNASIGKNCRIHVCVNIGTKPGEKNAPRIGDNCYIGPGVKIYGDIELADNISLGANSVVNKTCNIDGATLAGVPAKVIKNV